MNKNEIIKIAKDIISTEINGLQELQNYFNDDFIKVCEELLKLKGRIIVSGMGKSGHIGNKIASTLASTGTPASFVHPAESLHGDLGMITKNDVVLAISNSGNSTELAGIINYCLRFNIVLIAITSNKNSELGKAATYCLLLPKAKEACSLGLAPTTSTTNTLALGDALAITLLNLRGFTPDDFKIFHPGGSIGAKLIKIADVMHKNDAVPLINSNNKMSEAIITITSHKFGCVGVIDDNDNMIGIITDGDIRRNMSDNFLNEKVTEIMTKKLIHINENTTTSKALLLLNKHKITSLFVLKDNKPIGIIHLHDLLNLGVL